MTQTKTIQTRSEIYDKALQLKKEHGLFVQTFPKGNDENAVELWLQTARKYEADIADINLEILLYDCNTRQEKLRNLAKLAFNVERPTEDITTNDGSFHATKVKKYPKLQEVAQRGKFSVATLFSVAALIEVQIEGERFKLADVKSKYGEPDTITVFTTFDEMLKANGIEPEALTIEYLRDVIYRCNQINEEMKKAEERFSQQKEELGLYRLSNIGLFDQTHRSHVYEYRVKTVSVC